MVGFPNHIPPLWAVSDLASQQKDAGRLDSCLRVQALENVFDMLLDRSDTDVELSGGLQVGQSLGDEAQNFKLPIGQTGEGRRAVANRWLVPDSPFRRARILHCVLMSNHEVWSQRVEEEPILIGEDSRTVQRHSEYLCASFGAQGRRELVVETERSEELAMQSETAELDGTEEVRDGVGAGIASCLDMRDDGMLMQIAFKGERDVLVDALFRIDEHAEMSGCHFDLVVAGPRAAWPHGWDSCAARTGRRMLRCAA